MAAASPPPCPWSIRRKAYRGFHRLRGYSNAAPASRRLSCVGTPPTGFRKPRFSLQLGTLELGAVYERGWGVQLTSPPGAPKSAQPRVIAGENWTGWGHWQVVKSDPARSAQIQ